MEYYYGVLQINAASAWSGHLAAPVDRPAKPCYIFLYKFMSGHSKWATIKRAKAVTDKKKGAAFTKLSKAVTLAARGGPDPMANFKLRLAIDKAKEANMPKDTIDRAIKRGTGELEGAIIEEITYEGFGPGGVAVIISTLTDNKNRTVSNIKHIFASNGGNMGNANSVMWMFERKGVIRVSVAGLDQAAKEELELKFIETGAQDIKEEDAFLAIHTTVENLQKTKDAVEKMNQKIESADLEFVPKELLNVDDATKQKLEGLFEALDSDDDVQDFYSNANF